MAIKIEQHGSVTIINLKGDIDMQEVVQIRNVISAMVHEGRYQLVLDLSKVQHINSTGIGILADSLRRLRTMHGDLRLSQLNPYLHNIFELTGMTRYFRIYKKRQEAIRSYKAMNYAAA